MKFINSILKHKVVLVIVALGVIILPPFVTHLLYRIDSPQSFFTTQWNAGDILAYEGSILGALATIIVLILTINFTVKNQKEERKLSIKPFMVAKNSLLFMDELEAVEKEGCLFVKFEDAVLYASYKAADLIHINGNHNAFGPIHTILDLLSNKREICIIKYIARNVGSGNAINLSFILNGTKIITTGLPKNEHQIIVFILEKALIQDKSYKMELKLEYEDEASLAKYEQTESFTMAQDSQGFLYYSQVNDDILSSPKEIVR